MIIEHELKTHPIYFEKVYHGFKPWELRKNDRDFKVGELVLLKSFDPDTQKFSGSFIKAMITYILKDCPQFGLADGYCILTLDKIEQGFNIEYRTDF